ncbi:MAG: DUF1624 domain-containing protein [Leptospira sp.]|nr:DUF1624 domain-containing protein [Leptospira sp.]
MLSIVQNPRIIQADILRGAAILSMLGANLAGRILEQPHSLTLRICGTFAASTFVILSGCLIYLTSERKHYSTRHYLIRGLYILVAASIVDLFTMHVPLIYVDILSLLGMSIPIVYFSLSLKPFLRFFLVLAIFAITPILQNFFGYSDLPMEILFTMKGTVRSTGDVSGIISNWIIDGYFPIFPWIGFALLGTILMPIMDSYHNFSANRKILYFFLLIFFLEISIFIWINYPGQLLIRSNYSEMFYPPTIGYILTAIAAFLIVYQFLSFRIVTILLQPLQLPGALSLFVYIFHIAFIEYAIIPLCLAIGFTGLVPHRIYLLCYFLLVATVFIAVWLLKRLKERSFFQKFPDFIKFYFGG